MPQWGEFLENNDVHAKTVQRQAAKAANHLWPKAWLAIPQRSLAQSTPGGVKSGSASNRQKHKRGKYKKTTG